MKSIFLFASLLVLAGTVAAQSTVTFRENFFNNNRFKIDGQEAKAPEVARAMANFEASQKNFVEGHKQMRIGSGLLVIGGGVIVGALINFGLSDFTQDDVRTYFLISLSGMAVGAIGAPIRRKGKQRVETAVSEYNYQKTRGDLNQISVQFSSGKIGLVYNF